MGPNVRTPSAHAVALCCFLAAGSTVSSGDETPSRARAATSIPNMSCKPVPLNQGQLPPDQWHDCVGAYTFGNGNSYRGEFHHHGERDGFGVLKIEAIGSSDSGNIRWDEPSIYIGDFRRSRLNGYGLLIENSGVAYAGTFKDNIAQSDLIQKGCPEELSSAHWTNCIGTYRFPNGNVYRGEFANGLPEGIGMLQVKAIGSSDATQVRLPMPGTYIGQFKDGRLSGQGAVLMSNAGYFGMFSDNAFKSAAVKESGPGRARHHED